MVPARLAPILVSLIVSGLMSCMVSGVSTLRALGFIDGFFGAWMSNWAVSWSIAFPVLLIVGPIVRRAVAARTRD
ncbi:MAG: DUF2798 domain-containing protein [Pseudomonadota bacterium]